mmetsp:Transcript_34096/g.63222  ORF Transcript_34096/g.63222 Transcript_34096/m.63222 type:complete len:632 (-) Transcript_34096:181-2076(-)
MRRLVLALTLCSPHLLFPACHASSHIPEPNTLCASPPCSEQVHLQLGGPGEMVVVYVTANANTSSEVTYWPAGTSPSTPLSASGSAAAYSQLMWIDSGLIAPLMGAARVTEAEVLALQNTTTWALRAPFSPFGEGSSYRNPSEVEYGLGSYKNPQMVYTSPVVHTVRLTGLVSYTTYYYTVAGDARVFNFTMPPGASAAAYPFKLGLTADLGQTDISARTVERLRESLKGTEGSSVVLLSGDLAYADGYFPLWDTWGRFMEGLASGTPVMTVGGNHEYGNGEAWSSYNARYPMPFAQSGSVSNLWWSRDVGPVHLIGICSYAETSPGSLQYQWLSADLQGVNRSVTPWVVVMMHAPWYNSNSGHRAEAELMRRDMEPLVVAHGVDIVLNGHVHAYERMKPLYKGCVTPCGPVYLNLGNGGNREGAYLPWLEPQPYYSAFRASTFGPAILTIANATHAFYNFTRVGCQSADAASNYENLDAECTTVNALDGADNARNASAGVDALWIVRAADRLASCPEPTCSQPLVQGASAQPTSAPTSPSVDKACDDDGESKYSAGTLGGSIFASFVGGAVLGAAGVLCMQRRRDFMPKSSNKGGSAERHVRMVEMLDEGSTAENKGAEGAADGMGVVDV